MKKKIFKSVIVLLGIIFTINSCSNTLSTLEPIAESSALKIDQEITLPTIVGTIAGISICHTLCSLFAPSTIAAS